MSIAPSQDSFLSIINWAQGKGSCRPHIKGTYNVSNICFTEPSLNILRRIDVQISTLFNMTAIALTTHLYGERVLFWYTDWSLRNVHLCNIESSTKNKWPQQYWRNMSPQVLKSQNLPQLQSKESLWPASWDSVASQYLGDLIRKDFFYNAVCSPFQHLQRCLTEANMATDVPNLLHKSMTAVVKYNTGCYFEKYTPLHLVIATIRT